MFEPHLENDLSQSVLKIPDMLDLAIGKTVGGRAEQFLEFREGDHAHNNRREPQRAKGGIVCHFRQESSRTRISLETLLRLECEFTARPLIEIKYCAVIQPPPSYSSLVFSQNLPETAKVTVVPYFPIPVL